MACFNSAKADRVSDTTIAELACVLSNRALYSFSRRPCCNHLGLYVQNVRLVLRACSCKRVFVKAEQATQLASALPRGEFPPLDLNFWEENNSAVRVLVTLVVAVVGWNPFRPWRRFQAVRKTRRPCVQCTARVRHVNLHGMCGKRLPRCPAVLHAVPALRGTHQRSSSGPWKAWEQATSVAAF